MRILIILLLFITSNVLSQKKNNEISPLFSNGKTPEFLKTYEDRFYLPQDTPWIKGIKKDKKEYFNLDFCKVKFDSVSFLHPINRKRIASSPISCFIKRVLVRI